MADATKLPEDSEQVDTNSAYVRAIGARLRVVRNQIGLSLHAVAAMSNQEFKASVLGAYERGARAISVPRLQRLAKLYEIPVDQLLPPEHDTARWGAPDEGEEQGDGPGTVRLSSRARHEDRVAIDLGRLRASAGPESEMLRRFLKMIQLQRQDFNGHMITIRTGDLRAIVCLFGITADAMSRRLDELSLRAHV